MKKIFVLLLLFMAAVIKGNSQIGLLQTNSAIVKNSTLSAPSIVVDISADYRELIKPDLNKLDSTTYQMAVTDRRRSSLAKGYFINTLNERYENIKDSVSVLKKLSVFFFKECTGTDYKMWNYFAQFQDSSLVVKNHKQLIDSLSFAYGEFYQTYTKTDDHKEEVRQIESAVNSLQDSIDRWKDTSFTMIDESIKKADTLFSKQLKVAFEKLSALVKVIKQDIENLREHQKNYNRIVNTFFTKKEEKKTTSKEFAALPQVTSVIGEREVVPGIQMLGNKTFGNLEKDFITGEMGLLLGMQSAPDKPNLKTLFVDQASSFHIFTHFNYGFGEVGKSQQETANLKRLCINLHVSYSVKKILTDTIKTTKVISPSLFHTQSGIELAIIPRSLTLYGNVNTLTLFDKLAEFKSSLGVSRKFYGYIDWGAKILLDPETSLGIKNAKIFVNANFIINSGDVRYITRSEDPVITNIQIGIKASL